MYRYLLVLRFALVNITAAGLLGAVYLQGWLDGALVGHTGWLCLVIAAVFVYGFVVCTSKVWQVSQELNDVRDGTPPPLSRAARYLESVGRGAGESRLITANLLRLRLSSSIAIVSQVANTLVFLGLVGTVIGFIVALSGVDPQMSATVDKVAPMVATLISGMSIALYTTLVGAVLHVWLMVNHRMLATGTIHLFNAIVELGESRVGA